VLLKEMQGLSLDVNVVSEEGTDIEIREEEDDLLRAAEELGIDLSGVRATTRTESSPRTRPPTKAEPVASEDELEKKERRASPSRWKRNKQVHQT